MGYGGIQIRQRRVSSCCKPLIQIGLRVWRVERKEVPREPRLAEPGTCEGAVPTGRQTNAVVNAFCWRALVGPCYQRHLQIVRVNDALRFELSNRIPLDSHVGDDVTMRDPTIEHQRPGLSEK